MRLISARIQGYGRIVDSKVNLDAKVIAIVGPNEAGKTTLLKALAHVGTESAVPLTQRSRAIGVTDETRTITLEYVLDDADRNALEDLDLQEPPKRASIIRTASGDKFFVNISPPPTKSVAPLSEIGAVLKSSLEDEGLKYWINPETIYDDPNSDAPRNYRAELHEVLEFTDGVVAEAGPGNSTHIAEMAKSLADSTLEGDGGGELKAALGLVYDWLARDDPGGTARHRIWRRSPELIMFDEANRSIQSTYTFDEATVTNPPVALLNLAATASLNLDELLHFRRIGDTGQLRTAIVRANGRMDAVFGHAWMQSQLVVHFDIDGDELRIEILENGTSVTTFDERSAGLRMFVALIAFLKAHGSDRPPILLIDEAENHLHIDAQADLVNMFITQERAVKVIYTTHSPACLPPDLGTGIRTIVPRNDNTQISDIRNSFWQGAAGYSPLMLAMGAGAAAFTPARNVVLAEGATEMILLPTLLREAARESQLSYQIAPGISEVPKDFLPKLDLEAARVAYLVDSDDGGANLRELLVKAGTPENLIVELGAPGIENLLDPNAYREAVATLLAECNSDVESDILNELSFTATDENVSWANKTKEWSRAHRLNVPGKIAIANWLVQNGQAVPSVAGRAILEALHERLLKALGHEGSRRLSSASRDD